MFHFHIPASASESASEVTTLWRYINQFIIIIIVDDNVNGFMYKT